MSPLAYRSSSRSRLWLRVVLGCLLVAAIGWQFEYRAQRAAEMSPSRPPMPDPSAILATSIPVPASLLDPAGRPEWLRATPPSIWLQPGPPHVPENRTDRFLRAFDVAINPWQAGNYAESASRLALVAGEYPTSADVHFYLGAAWLLAGTPGEALVPLARAVELADTDERARDARWYLGLAALGAGLYGPALGAFGSGCALSHGVACAAAELLKTHSNEPS